MNEFLILYVLLKRAANIYEIKKYIDTNFAPFVEVSTGAVIPALKRLEKAGCVISKKIMTEGGLKKTTYTITQNGLKMLDAYIEQPIAGAPQLLRREVEILMLIMSDESFSQEQLAKLHLKIKNALEDNIKRINSALKYGNMNTEFLNMELIYSEAKLRMLEC